MHHYLKVFDDQGTHTNDTILIPSLSYKVACYVYDVLEEINVPSRINKLYMLVVKTRLHLLFSSTSCATALLWRLAKGGM